MGKPEQLDGGEGAQIDHTKMGNIGTNTHAQIDSHLGSTSNPHGVTAAQAGAEPSGAIATHTANAAAHHAAFTAPSALTAGRVLVATGGATAGDYPECTFDPIAKIFGINAELNVGSAPTFTGRVAIAANKSLTPTSGNYVFGFTIEGTLTAFSGHAFAMWLNPTLIPTNGNSAYFLYGGGTVDVGTGVTVNANAIYGATLVKTGVGSIGVASTLRLKPQTIGTVNYTINSESGRNFFGGVMNAPDSYMASPAEVSFYGDSITVGSNASETALSYPGLIATETGWTISNYAVAAKEIPDNARYAIYDHETVASDIAVLLSGYNDMRHHGTDAAGQATYLATLRAALAWLAIPDAMKISAQDAAVTYSGSWTNIAPYGYIAGKYSSSAGATATVTVYGSAIRIGFVMGTFPGDFTVTVDGTSYGTVDCTGVAPNSGLTYWPAVFRISGLVNGPHTVVVTVVGGANIYLDYFAGNNFNVDEVIPRIFAGNTLLMNATGYALGGTTWDNGSDAAVMQFNAIHRRVVGELVADGFNVVDVNATAAYNPYTSDVDSDNIHPSDDGHAKIARAFLMALTQFINPRDRHGSYFARLLAGMVRIEQNGIIVGQTGQQLGLYGKTPVTQPAVPTYAALTTTETADATYSSNEVDMLNHLKADVTALRAAIVALTNKLDQSTAAIGAFSGTAT